MTQQVEIECKYRITDHKIDELRKILRIQCVKHDHVEKHDTYYILIIKNSEKLLRIRRIRNTCVLTYKEKQLHANGIERNTEYDVEIKDEHAMHTMLNALGAKLYIKKYKLTESFTLPSHLYGNIIVVELTEVPPLGHFVEIECVADTNKENLKPFYNTISRIAAAYNLSQDALEKRLYIDMLKNTEYLKN